MLFSINIFALTTLYVINLASKGEAIRCYQCSSDEDKTNDYCGAFEEFDKTRNTAVECMGPEANSPGTFCFKSIQQGVRGFIWDGRWRTVIRRCAQVSDRGVSWGCAYGYRENGDYWEECYCADDECNASIRPQLSQITIICLILSLIWLFKVRSC